jgi:hypothetical protein
VSLPATALPFIPRSPAVRRALRDGLVIAGLLFGGYLFIVVAPVTRTFGFNAYAYWHLDLAAPYSQLAGGLHLLIAAAIVLDFRWPATWAFVILTKVTPGVGLVWFAVRREWRRLAIALGVTAALVLISLVIDPALWRAWLPTTS